MMLNINKCKEILKKLLRLTNEHIQGDFPGSNPFEMNPFLLQKPKMA